MAKSSTKSTEASTKKSSKSPSASTAEEATPKKTRKSTKSAETSKATTATTTTTTKSSSTKPKTSKKDSTTVEAHPTPQPFVITEDQIRERAYFISERRNKLGWPGDPESDWLEAERQLREEAELAQRLK